MAVVNRRNISTAGFDEDALVIDTSGKHLLNFGRLTTTGDLADGIFANANDVSIRNFGRIETSGLGAAGVFVLGDDARVENYGSVVTHGDFFDPDPAVDGDESFSEGMTVIGDRFHVANHGSVLVEGESSSGLAGVGADGIVINYGRVDSSATNSSAIGVFGDRSRVINTGQVAVEGEDNTAVFALGEDASAVNLRHILMTGSGHTGVEGVIVDTHLANYGIIRMNGDESFGMAGFGDGHQISNFGLIEALGTFSGGIEARGIVSLGFAGLDIEILNAGRIVTDGDLGIGISLGLSSAGLFPGFTPAEDGRIVNRGVIEAKGDGAAGVVMIGDGHRFTNSGRIATDGGVFDGEPVGLFRAAGVVVSGDDALVENARSGVIRSMDPDSAAVELNVLERDGFPASAMSSRLVNSGLIVGADVAIEGGAGQETVINHGRIVGDVMLGDGADTFVFGRSGSVAGDVFLGDGSDTVRIENGSGTSRVADFAAGAGSEDVIDVSAFFSDFDDVMHHGRQRGSDVVIELDNNDTLVLENVQLVALRADDFLV
jgi:hypothetical protein